MRKPTQGELFALERFLEGALPGIRPTLELGDPLPQRGDKSLLRLQAVAGLLEANSELGKPALPLVALRGQGVETLISRRLILAEALHLPFESVPLGAMLGQLGGQRDPLGLEPADRLQVL